MSDAPNTPVGEDGKPATAENPNPKPAAPAQEPEKDWKAEAAKAREAGDDLATWKAEARKWEAQAKENKAAADRLAELEEAAKTEEQKRAEQLAELQAKVAEYETRDQINAWKAEVAEATGVPVAALAGSTKEEIEAHAEILKPLIAQPNQPPANQPLHTIGNQPERTGSVPLKDQIAAAEKAGDKALVASLKAIQLGSTE